MEKRRNAYQMLVGKSFDNVYIEKQGACEWTTLRHILGRQILKIGSGRIDLLSCPVGDGG